MIDLGPLYAFAQSTAGQFLIKRNRSGSVVDSIYESDVSSMLFPILPRKLREHLTELVQQVSALRSDANALLNGAEAELQRQCDFPDFSAIAMEATSSYLGEAATFVISSSDFWKSKVEFGDVRLNVRNHDRVAASIRAIVAPRSLTLGEVAISIRRSSLRKRTYVEDARDGIALIGGKQLCQARPVDVKFLSAALTSQDAKERLARNSILLACIGTVGRLGYVYRNFEDWTVSENVMRLVIDEAAMFPGFVFAFLHSQYGQVLIQSAMYGSVQDALRDIQVASLPMPCIPDKGEAVHTLVIEAFNLYADAKESEDKAISLFETAIEQGRDATEEKWGREY
jgi:hypothetical protein